MADPSVLARGRIQILEGESLTVRGPPGSSCRYQGASKLQGPSKVAEQRAGQPSSSSRKSPRPGPPLSFHSRAPRQDQGPGRAHGLQRGGGEAPGGAWRASGVGRRTLVSH